MDSAAVKEYLLELQDLIVTRLEQVDGKNSYVMAGSGQQVERA